MIGCAGPSFDTSSSLPSNIPSASASDRLSFFSLCFASAITWAPSSADYFVYLPSTTSSWRMFIAASTGMSVAMALTTLLGIGLATGIDTNAAWIDASLSSPGSLLAASFSNLHSFGRFCAVVLLIGTVSNNIPCTYSAGLNLQMLGRYGPRIPRPLLTTVEVVIYTVCAIVAREYLREIMENFLPLMSYWIVAWFAVCLEEACIFRRRCDYDWTMWNNAHRLPMGLAAGASFVLALLGAILGMVSGFSNYVTCSCTSTNMSFQSQSYFVGPIARALPPNCDLGMWLAFGFTAVVYPPLRLVELRIIGR
jgi:purine-cytosine permease-like protein